jgi:type II secretory pathway pseudopilin PulG
MPVVMVTSRPAGLPKRRDSRRGVLAFTIIDLLVSIAIMTVLIALILPSISSVREATRRVICSSNQRQIGLGIAMYSDDSNGQPPFTVFEPKNIGSGPSVASPQNTNIIRDTSSSTMPDFDGLGLLFKSDYLNAPQVFYCPSHHGNHPYSKYASVWADDTGRIVINYQYRGTQAFALGQPDRRSLVADGLATRSDYSHNVGSNILRADFSVSWLPDLGGTIARALPEYEGDSQAAAKVSEAWTQLDRPPPSIPNGP